MGSSEINTQRAGIGTKIDDLKSKKTALENKKSLQETGKKLFQKVAG